MKGWTLAHIEKIKAGKEKKVKLPNISTNDLTKHALRVLDLKGFEVWRQNNGGVYDPTKKVFRSNSSTPGISDILGFHRKTGQIIACEIKNGNDKLSEDQTNFLNKIKASGGVAMVVKSIDDLEKFMDQ